jgi:hypothetical protein
MAFGAVLVGVAVVALAALRIVEVRAWNRRLVSLVRPPRDGSWQIAVEELEAAARDAGLPIRRHHNSLSWRGKRVGCRLDVERARPDELGWVIWSNDTAMTVAMLRAFVARFGPLSVSIPLEIELVNSEVYPLAHERMTIRVDDKLAPDTLAGKLDAAHDELVDEILKCLKLRIEGLDLLLARMTEQESAQPDPE